MRTTRRGRAFAAITTAAAVVAAIASPALTATAAVQPPQPLVVGAERLPAGAGAAGTTDLTAQGGLDWVHADGGATETKRDRTDAMTLTSLRPETPTVALSDSPVAFAWSDGARQETATGVTTGAVYRYDLTTVGDATEHDAGFRLTVPSGQGTRQLTLVGGIWQASADLTVATTDGATVQTSRLSAGGSAAVQRTTVTMRPGEGAVVTATLRAIAGRDGNVSFMGAALRSLDDGPQLTAGPTPQRLDLTAAGTSDWLHLDGATVDRSRDGDGSLGVVDRDPAGTIKQQGDNPTTYSWTNGVPTATQDGTRTGGVFLAPGDDATKPSGWDLTVRADRAPRTLQFVAGVWQASARLSVTLDDTAEPVLTDTGLTAGGSAVSHLYTLTIPAGAAARVSAQLTATTESGGNGNVTLAGVALAPQDHRAELTGLVQQARAVDLATADEPSVAQLEAETATASALLDDAGSSDADVQSATHLLRAALAAVTASASGARYTWQSHPGLTSSFGWEGDVDAPIAFIDGSYRLRDHGDTMITFGVPDIPGKISWENAEGYLPAFVSRYAKAGLDISVQSFADEATVGGNRYEVAYSRMTVTNTTDTAATLPRVSSALVPLDGTSRATTVDPGATVVRDYAVGADRFGGTYAWPSDAQIAGLGSYDDHYAHMRTYWNDRLATVADITALPDPGLIDAYKAGYIYTLIIRDDVDGQKQLHVGENGYDEMFDHDTIGIVSNLLNMGDFAYAKDYLATLPAELQYQDAKWKYSAPYAMYLERTGDDTFVRDHFATIRENTHTIASDREDDGTGIIKITNAIDSDGHWTVDNWSALYGLSTYRYLAERLGDDAEASWAQSEYDSLMAAANARLDATRSEFGIDYMPMAMDEPNETGPRSDPRDANWASMFLFGGWAWDSYLYDMPQSGTMLDSIDETYAYGIDRRKDVSDSPANFGGYPHGYYSSAYNAGYGGAALRGEDHRDIGIKAYQFMIEHSQSGPFGWWEGVDQPKADSPWDIDHASGGGGSDQHMWGQAMGTKVLFDSLLSLKSDGSLIVGRGVPADWVSTGKQVALDRFPVQDGGRVGYAMTADDDSVHLTFSGDLDRVPSISVQLLALEGNIASVDVPGATVDRAAGTVTLPKGTESVTIGLGEATVTPAPTATELPTISGQPTVGSTLTAHPGTWSTDGLTFRYQWLRDGEPVAAARARAASSSATYLVAAADAGHRIAVRVTASRAGSEDGTATSRSVTITRATDGAGAGGGGAGGGTGGGTDPGVGNGNGPGPGAGTGGGTVPDGRPGSLAFTGNDLLVPLSVLAAVLLAAGLTATVVRRRRTSGEGATPGSGDE